MIPRRALLSTAVAATAAIGLSACGGEEKKPKGSGASDGTSLSAVTVSEDLGAEPKAEFAPPLKVTQPEAKDVVPGKGAKIKKGDSLILHSAYIDAQNGDVLDSWWQGAPPRLLTVDEKAIGKEAFTFLTTAAVGSRIAMTGWQNDQTGQPRALLQVADIDHVVSPLRAEGARREPAGAPVVEVDKSGKPSLKQKPEGKAPAKTERQMLVTGTKDPTAAGELLVMHYTGWSFDDGKQFDSSWDRGQPFGFVQGQQQVIKGWDENLVGIPVGSQVMLIIPPAEAYGEDPKAHELGGKTLLFVIDVLDSAKMHG